MEDNNKKIIRIVKVIYIAAIVLLVIAAAVLCFWGKGKENQNNGQNDTQTGNQQNQAVQTENNQNQAGQDEYEISVQEKDGNKIINNDKAGISITVPKEWSPQTVYKTNDDLKLKLSKVGPEQPEEPSEMNDGFTMEIFSYDTYVGLDKWLQENDIKDYKAANFQGIEAFEKNSKVKGQLDADLNFTPIEDSLYKAMFVYKNNKIYEIGCSSFGEKYSEYNSECFNVVNSSLKL